MSLSAGNGLGPYEIVAPLGAGGMGEVYRARDTKLDREVAIKVLPAGLAQDAARLTRFEREARLLASLNHPNIAAIYGLEEAGDTLFLVLELVEGEDLAKRLKRGAIPLDEATAIAKQIAAALEEAHEKGIVHRDLKPANVRQTPGGKVKILDFGLAKAYASDSSGTGPFDSANSPTVTQSVTMAGTILGTAAYMAPEQACGKTVDRRADIWAFGALFYEMLSGRRAFGGDDLSTTLASVLKDDVSWEALPAELPAPLRRLLRRCLEKDPRRRLSCIADARLELDETESAAAASTSPAGRRSISLPGVLGVAAVAMLVGAGVMHFVPPAAVAPSTGGVTHLAIALPDGDEIAETDRMPLALSPDGTLLTYVGRRDGKRQLFLRKLSEREPTAIAGTESATIPFFSPDGQWIAFFSEGKLKKVAVGGAGLQVIWDDVPDPRGGSWGADGNIYFTPTLASGIWRVPATGGAATELTRTDPAQSEISHRWPCVLPDPQALLFTIWTGPGADERRIVVQSIATGEREALVPGGDSARYLTAGYLVYARLGSLFAVPWDPTQNGRGGAAAVSLPEHPRLESQGAAAYAISNNGTLAYLPGGAARYAQRVLWVDRAGTTETLPLPERDYESVAVSPDGRQAVVQVMEGTAGLWLYDFSRQTLTPFATSGGSSQAPLWTADGRRIIYRGTRGGSRNLYWKAVDGTSDEERLTTKNGVTQSPASVSPDGLWLVFSEFGGPARGEGTLWRLRLTGERTPQRLIQASGGVFNGRISPDGKWLAYVSSVSGRAEVHVQPFPGPGPSQQLSDGGGTEPLWSRDGRELFYLRGDKLMAVDIVSAPSLAAGRSHVLIEGRYRPTGNRNTAYDVSADGRRFLRVQQAQPERPVDQVDVVLNWVDELKRIAATK